MATREGTALEGGPARPSVGWPALGTLPLGWLADSTGAPFAVALAGSLVVLFSIAVTWRLPQMRAL